MRIIELKKASEFSAIFPLVKQVNTQLTKPEFQRRLKSMLDKGYRCIAAEENGKLLAICGFWTGTRFWCGAYIDIDNLIVDKSARSRGIGSKLVRWVEKEGKRLGCDISVLDSYTTNHASHRFYLREGYVILGYHFTKPLKP